MALWQWGLLLLAVVWALQSYGVWLQMRHYSDVFKGITQKYADGFVGTGAFHDQLRAEPALFGEKQPGLTAAITQAVAQIDRTRAGEEPPLRESLAASKA